MAFNIAGRLTRTLPAAMGGGGPGLTYGGHFTQSRAMLRSRNWTWNPYLRSQDNYSTAWGNNRTFLGLIRVPYSWNERRKLVEEARTRSLNDVLQNAPAVDDDMRKTFKRINELQEKPGKTLDQCRAEIEVLHTKIGRLEAMREAYRRTEARHTATPKLTDTGKTALLNARMAEEMATAVACAMEQANESASALGSQAIIDGVVNGIQQSYKAGSPERLAAINAAQIVTIATAAAVGGGTARSVASAAKDAANAAAKSKMNIVAATTLFKGSPQMNALAQQIKDCERQLRELGTQTMMSLCNADPADYRNEDAFGNYYTKMWTTFNQLAEETTGRLDALSISLGLPSVRKDKQASSAKHQIKQGFKNLTPGLYEGIGSVLFVGVEAGVYALLAGATLPGWVGGAALGVVASVVNFVALKAITWAASDD